MNIVNCILCDVELETEDGMCHDGVICVTTGNYGSTVYDPMPEWSGTEDKAKFYMCDKCLAEKANKMEITGDSPSQELSIYSKFHPGNKEFVANRQAKSMAKNPENYTCLCTKENPCSSNCTCVDPTMSGGCLKCCKYGSYEQRLEKAKALLDEAS